MHQFAHQPAPPQLSPQASSSAAQLTPHLTVSRASRKSSCACGGTCPRCKGNGQPLDDTTRTFMESRFGRDFSDVRIHADVEAAASARALRARAYTSGSSVVFAEGAYRPEQEEGRRLIAHELAHVVQRDRATSASPEAVTQREDAWERDASRMANDVFGSTPGPVVSAAPQSAAPAIMREPDEPEPVTEELQPYRIPGTPLTVIPLEKAQGNESITLFGVRLPYRAVRLTNENEITPLPAIPESWRDVPGLFKLTPDFKNTLTTGAPFTGRNVSDVVKLQPAPPGQPAATIPRFSFTARTSGFSIDVTDKIPLELRPDVIPGTPLGGAADEGNIQRHSIVNPSIAIGKRAFLTGKLSLHDKFPSHYTSPTEIDLTFRSEPLGSLTARETPDLLDFGTIGSVRANALGIGAAKGEVQAFIDLTRIDDALAPLGMDRQKARAARDEIVALVQQKIRSLLQQQPSLGSVINALSALSSQGSLAAALQPLLQRHARPGTSPTIVQRAAENVIEELRGPGFEVQGPIYFGAPIGYAYFRAPTTRYLRAPFEGSGIGLPHPATLATIGPTIIPKGIITDFTTPAGGGTLARDWESIALSATIAGKPSLEPGSIGGAGVATGRIGFRVQGFDVVIEGGWRGRAALGQGAGEKEPFRRDFLAIAAARQQAQARFAEGIESTEAGVFAPDLLPAEVLPQGRPDAEFYGVFRIIKRFHGP